MPKKPIKAYKHKSDKRAHLPSSEEAGYEEASARVKETEGKSTYPRNPIIHRGQDPELYWMNKYGTDDTEDTTEVDIRSLYRHEHIAPEKIIKGLYKVVADKDPNQDDLFSPNELFGNALEKDELEKVSDYYTHSDGWTNRLIQGDSLLVMNSLLEREGMAGQVQCIYIDPPYGIKYGSNWQVKINNRTVTDGKDDHLSGEPEIIKAFRDTWELGIHSYLSYLRDRLMVARELLHESGSCFVQISDENVHLVRCLMDEVFGSENFVSLITVQKTSSKSSAYLGNISDYILYYSKNYESLKFRQLYYDKLDSETLKRYNYLDTTDGNTIKLTKKQVEGKELIPDGRRWGDYDLQSQGETTGETSSPFLFDGETYHPKKGRHWSNPPSKLENATRQGRIVKIGNFVRFKRYADDFPVSPISNLWSGTAIGKETLFVVQTSDEVISRCILMASDPGDLILDPTCGSGTTALASEKWGRRWITIDTSRVALNIAKTRICSATLPYFRLHDTLSCDLRQGFEYKTVKRITLRALSYEEPPQEIILYDCPKEDKKRLRVAGPFTVETLQNYEPISPEELAKQREDDEELAGFEQLVFEHLETSGIRTGDKKEQAVFTRVDPLSTANLHAEGYFPSEAGEKKAFFHIGPKFGTVSKRAVNEAVKECRQKGDADWLVILGFSFESGINEVTKDMGNFQVSIVRMHDDLMQDGLLKRDKKAASFVTIGEPDIRLIKDGDTATVEIAGLDIYDPIKDEVKSRDVADIAYWMLDDDYDGSNFIVKQIFFCGGEKKEFEKWKKGLDNIAKQSTKKKAEQTLKIEIDDEAFDALYGHISRPFPIKKDQKIAVRVISQFGEETTKII